MFRILTWPYFSICLLSSLLDTDFTTSSKVGYHFHLTYFFFQLPVSCDQFYMFDICRIDIFVWLQEFASEYYFKDGLTGTGLQTLRPLPLLFLRQISVIEYMDAKDSLGV